MATVGIRQHGSAGLWRSPPTMPIRQGAAPHLLLLLRVGWPPLASLSASDSLWAGRLSFQERGGASGQGGLRDPQLRVLQRSYPRPPPRMKEFCLLWLICHSHTSLHKHDLSPPPIRSEGLTARCSVNVLDPIVSPRGCTCELGGALGSKCLTVHHAALYLPDPFLGHCSTPSQTHTFYHCTKMEVIF